MKKSIFFFLTITLCLNLFSQDCSSSCMDFLTAADYSKTHRVTGFVVTVEDFLNHKVEEVQDFQYNGYEGAYTYTKDGVKAKSSIADMQKKYYGYVVNGQLNRIFLQNPGWAKPYNSISLRLIGNVCIWGGVGISNVIVDEDDNNIYTYCSNSDLSRMISIGLNGELIDLTNENFANVLGAFDNDLKTMFLEELDKQGLKLKKTVTYHSDSFKIFIKYFEAVNKIIKE